MMTLPSIPDPSLTPVVLLMQDRNHHAAAEVARSVLQSTEDVLVRAWALALCGVAETRRGRFHASLQALDAAHELAHTAAQPRLADRIRIDRLLPLAHVAPDALPAALRAARELVSTDLSLATLFGVVEQKVVPMQPSGPALQLVSENLPTEKRLSLRTGTLRIGRRRTCDLQILVDAEVSRLHCEVVCRTDGWHVRDHSTHGNTEVRGCATPTGPLLPGASIRLGATVLRVCA